MSYYNNFHQAPMFYVNGIKYINDYDLEEYRPQIKSFLTKRRTAKREIRKIFNANHMLKYST